MAITKTRVVGRIEVYPAIDADSDPRLMVVYENTFDDSEDDTLPETTTSTKFLERNIVSVDEEGTETSTPTDVTGEDQLVQDVCGAVWTD